MILQGDIWLLDGATERRPVLIVTRDVAIPLLNAVVVAPITSTIRGIPTEVPVGVEHGIDHASVAAFDALTVVSKRFLARKVGSLGFAGDGAICAALRAMADC